MSDIILRTEGLTKHYGGVEALTGATFELKRGEHVAIMGDNGAGKSTFVRQITAVEQRTSGKVMFDGEEVNFKTPLEARQAGIETVFQNLALADDLDVPSILVRSPSLISKPCAHQRSKPLSALASKFPTSPIPFAACLVVSGNAWRLPVQRHLHPN
jgi:ABC-type sugar transport system ATPase subunit